MSQGFLVFTLADIEEINVFYYEESTGIDVELKVRGRDSDVVSVFRKLFNQNKSLKFEVRGTLENDQGESVQGQIGFVGKVLQLPKAPQIPLSLVG